MDISYSKEQLMRANMKLEQQNKRYREAIKDIKKTWKNPHNPYNQLDEIHEIIKELEGEE